MEWKTYDIWYEKWKKQQQQQQQLKKKHSRRIEAKGRGSQIHWCSLRRRTYTIYQWLTLAKIKSLVIADQNQKKQE